jgi:hypothetical protein
MTLTDIRVKSLTQFILILTSFVKHLDWIIRSRNNIFLTVINISLIVEILSKSAIFLGKPNFEQKEPEFDLLRWLNRLLAPNYLNTTQKRKIKILNF